MKLNVVTLSDELCFALMEDGITVILVIKVFDLYIAQVLVNFYKLRGFSVLLDKLRNQTKCTFLCVAT